MSTLIVMPVNMAVIWIFQKVKRKVNMDKDMEKDAEEYEIKGKKGKFQLPRWMLYPAWIGNNL